MQEFDTLDKQRSKPGKPVYHHGVDSRLNSRHWDKGWLLGWRDICRSTDERTLICGTIPRIAVGHKSPLAFVPLHAELLYANLSSLMLDYVVRQKISGTSMTYFVVKQLPIITPAHYDYPVAWLNHEQLIPWIRQRVIELSYTAWDMEAFARDLGDGGAPFRWNDERRTLMRAELDAAYFHLYGLEHGEVEHVMNSFEALRRREERQLGEFRTMRLILERYDAMTQAAQTGTEYQTLLDPPPGHGTRHAPRLARS